MAIEWKDIISEQPEWGTRVLVCYYDELEERSVITCSIYHGPSSKKDANPFSCFYRVKYWAHANFPSEEKCCEEVTRLANGLLKWGKHAYRNLMECAFYGARGTIKKADKQSKQITKED